MGKWTWENIGGQEDTHSSSPISSIQVSHLLFVYFPSKSSTEKTKTKPKTKKKKKNVKFKEICRSSRCASRLSRRTDRRWLVGQHVLVGGEKKQTNKKTRKKNNVSTALVDVSVGRDQNRNNGNSPAHLGGGERRKQKSGRGQWIISFVLFENCV